MNVYIVRYEQLDVFSTARKALEHLEAWNQQGQEWEAYINGEHVLLTVDIIPSLITKLNKDWFITFHSGREELTIEKEGVH